MRPQPRGVASREEKLDALQQKLAESVGNLVTGDDWKRAMEFETRIRTRSFNNTLLIYAQHAAAFQERRVPEPAPSYVAGFSQWLSLGRHVMKGRSGYAILAPVTARFAPSTPTSAESWRRLGQGEAARPGAFVRKRLVDLRPAHVWDPSQIDGDRVPEPSRPILLQGRASARLRDGLADHITSYGFDLRLVSHAEAIGGANGLTDYTTREVSVRMDMDDAAQVETLNKELGHVILPGPANADAAALLESHAGRLVLLGQQSGAVVVSGVSG